MAPCDGLRGLQMGEPRHDPVGPRLGLRQKRADQGFDPFNGGVHLVAHPKFEIGRHLIIARTARVQTPRRLADDLFEPRFDIHMDVFERRGKFERAALDL